MKAPTPEPPKSGRSKRNIVERDDDRREARGWDEGVREASEMMRRKGARKRVRST